MFASNYSEDNVGVFPDALTGGFSQYRELKTEYIFYNFVCTNVRRMQPDVKWRKRMKQNAGRPFFCMITSSNIAYVCAIIKSGKDMWDQAKRLMNDLDSEPKTKAKPLFSTGEGKKREIGKSVWNMEDLEFY